MSRLSKKNIISGRIGNLVFREFNGKQIVQSRPEEVKQTKATQLSSSEFTQCSRWAKGLRLFLIPFLVGLTDSYMYKRFTGQLYSALQSNTDLPKGQRNPCNADMSALAGFEFNIHSPFVAYFFPALTATLDAQRRLTVTIPELEPKTEMVFAARTTQAELLVYVLATIFQLGYHYPNAKSRYRGEIKHQMWANIRCLWVNFVRILKYIKQLCQRTSFFAKYEIKYHCAKLIFAFHSFLTAILPNSLSRSENTRFLIA